MREIKDHSPSNYEQHRDCTFFLSFDEWAELEGNPWIKEATVGEVSELRRERQLSYESNYKADSDKAITHDSLFQDMDTGSPYLKEEAKDWESLFSDPGTGRPYLVVTVLKTAPGHIWRQASGYLRLFRFRDDA